MSIVNDRINAAKPPPPANDPKAARLAVNNNKDLDVDIVKEEPSFFGSFFNPKNKKRLTNGRPESPVCITTRLRSFCTAGLTSVLEFF